MNRRLFAALPLLAFLLPPPALAEEPKGVFVAVGYGGRRITTADGATWANDQEDASNGGDDNNCLFSVCFAQNKFVAVGGGGGRGRILVTPDGKDWREVKNYRFRVNPVLYGNNLFIAGTQKQFETSADGETWSTAGKIDTRGGLYFRKGAFGNGVFVFCGDISNPAPPGAPAPKPGDPPRPRDGWRCATKDGKTVDALQTDLPSNQLHIAFGNGRFVICGKGGYRQHSADGAKWDDASDNDEDFRSVFFTGKQFVLNGKKQCYASDDGVAWKPAGKSFNATPLAAGNGLFIGASWKTAKYVSPDALTWKLTDKDGTNALEAAAFGTPSGASAK